MEDFEEEFTPQQNVWWGVHNAARTLFSLVINLTALRKFILRFRRSGKCCDQLALLMAAAAGCLVLFSPLLALLVADGLFDVSRHCLFKFSFPFWPSDFVDNKYLRILSFVTVKPLYDSFFGVVDYAFLFSAVDRWDTVSALGGDGAVAAKRNYKVRTVVRTRIQSTPDIVKIRD